MHGVGEITPALFLPLPGFGYHPTLTPLASCSSADRGIGFHIMLKFLRCYRQTIRSKPSEFLKGTLSCPIHSTVSSLPRQIWL